MNKLKPVVFYKTNNSYYKHNIFQQNLLLKALQITSDPKKLKELMGVKKVADVYRTLDKIALRKEFHEALAVHGLDMFTIVDGIKGICQNAKNDGTRLRGYEVILKALGLSEYKEENGGGAGWEEALKVALEKEKKGELLGSGNTNKEGDYDVVFPEVPRGIKEEREASLIEERKMYDK
jgi:hypothetical protein